MNRTTPILLLVLVALAGTYVVVFEMRRLPEADVLEMESQIFKVTKADAAKASALTVSRPQGALALARGADGLWRLAKPVEALARQEAAFGIVRDVLLVRRTGGQIPADRLGPKGLSVYGLDKPRVTATVRVGEGAGARELVLLVGDADPTNHYVYVKQPGDTGVSLVDRWVAERLELPLGEFREARFVRFDMSRLASLRVRSALSAVELAYRDGAWSVTKPYEDRADSLRVEGVLRALGELEAKAFAAEAAGNLAPFGLDRPRVEVTFVLNDNTTSTVLLGGPCKDPVGTVYAKIAAQTPIYAVSASVVDALTFAPDYLRSRRLAMIGTFGVEGITIERPGSTLVMKKESGAWKIASPVAMDADESAVDDFVRAVSELEVQRFANDAPDDAALAACGLDEKSRATLTLRLADKPPLVFDVGRVDPANKDLFLRRRGAPGIVTVPESFAARVSETPLDFRQRKVLTLNRALIRKLVLRLPAGGVTVEKAVDGKWRLTAPVDAPADEINVGAILDDVADLVAVRFVVDKAERPAEYGLDKPAFELTVETFPAGDKAAEKKTILVGKELGAGEFAAKLGEADAVFAASGEMVDRLRAELRKREIWKLDPSTVSAATWQSGAVKVVVRRQGNAFTLVAPAGATLAPDALERMIGSVAYLRSERFEAYAKGDLAWFGLAAPRATLTVTADGRDYVLSVGADKDAQSVFACVSTEDVVFTLPKAHAALLMTSPLGPAAPPAAK